MQGNIYMLIADGTNLTASLGADGILLVNSGSAQMSDKILAAVKQLATASVSPAGRQRVLRRELSGSLGMGEPVLQRGDQLAGAAQAASLHHQHQRGAGQRRRQREDRHLRLLPAQPPDSAPRSRASGAARRSSRMKTCSTG